MDADHIAAIDNVTRRIVEKRRTENKLDQQPPLTVGLFFSLGHSSVVILAVLVIVLAVSIAKENLDEFGSVAGIIGTSVSIAVLFILVVLNSIVLASLLRLIQRVKQFKQVPEIQSIEAASDSATDISICIEDDENKSPEEKEFDALLNELQEPKSTGLLRRFIAPMLKSIDASWKMYPIGFLFGIGFDTSTEIGLLAISASSLTQNTEQPMPTAYIMFLPLLFTAGMSFVDTLDGIIMSNLYTWAYTQNPLRKVFFNLLVTLTSIFFGAFIALVQLMCLLSDQLGYTGPLWDFWQAIADRSEIMGASIAGLFIVSWAISWLIYTKFKRVMH